MPYLSDRVDIKPGAIFLSRGLIAGAEMQKMPIDTSSLVQIVTSYICPVIEYVSSGGNGEVGITWRVSNLACVNGLQLDHSNHGSYNDQPAIRNEPETANLVRRGISKLQMRGASIAISQASVTILHTPLV